MLLFIWYVPLGKLENPFKYTIRYPLKMDGTDISSSFWNMPIYKDIRIDLICIMKDGLYLYITFSFTSFDIVMTQYF